MGSDITVTSTFDPPGIRLGVVRGISYGLFGPAGEFGAQARDAVPALTEALKDRDKGVRVAAAYALAAIGPEARAAVPALQAAAKDKDGDIRTATAYALQQIEGKK